MIEGTGEKMTNSAGKRKTTPGRGITGAESKSIKNNTSLGAISSSSKEKAQKSGIKYKKPGSVIKLADNSQSHPNLIMKPDISPDNIIFALDIGTRTVVGVVGVQEGSCFRVLATEIVEHKNRAMLDGQIHDIEQVAIAASEVKQKLENRIGIKLEKVAIAAAGRVLKTCQVKVEKNLELGREIDADFISSLEIEGIQRAQILLDEESAEEDKTQFYCVGYSVISYYLNGFTISNLSGHKGKNAGADVLATFLPLIVVDSLYSVMNKVGLEVRSLTLEPIAAINVTIPPDLRLLNLALVDIGAGTSDIALTKDGSVFAYAMVPIAGDEITEKISQHYLVDFNTGEKLKIALSSGKKVVMFTDILKQRQNVSAEEVLAAIGDTVQLLASTIAQRILEFNHKAPNAVFLVGGGSRIPGLAGLIAQHLGLPGERVVVRGRDVIRDIRYNDKKLYGPESITPYGIAVTAQMYSGKDFLTVTVNEKKIKLFNSKKLTVADALILFGYDAGSLIGRSGKGMSFNINGDIRQVRGEYGKAAEIYINGKLSGLDTPISYGDSITVIPAQNGKDASVRAFELVSEYSMGIVKLNGNPVDIGTTIFINGRQVQKDMQIKDGDIVKITQIKTLSDILKAGGFNDDDCDISVNDDTYSSLDYVLKDKDNIVCKVRESTTVNPYSNSCAEEMPQLNGEATFSQKISDFSQMQGELFQTNHLQETSPSDQYQETSPQTTSYQETSPQKSQQVSVTVNDKAVILSDNRAQYIFVDIFNYIDFDLTKPQGTIVLKLNGRPAAFTDVIRSGDKIEIYWKK